MSFQFPANPKDGDVVVQPQEGGGFIKGTYNEAANTWEVGELPEEPGVPGPQGPTGAKGEKGDPGKGMNISGIVDTYDDLESPGLHPLQFWIVDDVNKVYYSDGNAWFDQGGPVVGPQGEGLTSVTANDTPQEYTVTFEGTQPELNLTTPNLRGATGAPGKGWNSTTIIDERPDNYQIRFNSDDGLEFTTDSIMGPPGDMEVASETNCGCIKIGRGLDIAPDGSAASGETYVDLETVPLGTDGRPDLPIPTSFQLDFIPAVGTLSDTVNNHPQTGEGNAGGTSTQSVTIQVPSLSNGAIVYYFVGSSCRILPSSGWTVGNATFYPSYLHLVSNLSVSGASFADGLGLSIPMKHNIGGNNGQLNQGSEQPTTKIGQIVYPTGTTSLTFTQTVSVEKAKSCYATYGRCRVILVPYKSEGDDTTRGISYMLNPLSTVVDPDDPINSKDYYNPHPQEPTPEEIAQGNSDDLKTEVYSIIQLIDQLTVQQYTSGSIYDALMEKRQQLIDMRDLPGTYEELYAYFTPIAEFVKSYYEYDFRFAG